MRKGPLFSILIGILGAVASFMVLVVSTNVAHDNILGFIFLPFHIAIALFVVFFKKPTIWELILRIMLFIPVYVLLYKSDLNEIIFDIVNNHSAAFLGVPATIFFDSVAIGITFIIASLVRLANYAGEKAKEQMNIEG